MHNETARTPLDALDDLLRQLAIPEDLLQQLAVPNECKTIVRPTTVVTGSSRHTTIRLPADVLTAFLNEAERRGVGYQTLMVSELRSAIGRW